MNSPNCRVISTAAATSLLAKDSYQLALMAGFRGTLKEWLDSLGAKYPGKPGKDGKSAYEIAVEYGYLGTESEWLASLPGAPGESAYQIAVRYGFRGTELEYLNSLQGKEGKAGKDGEIINGESINPSDYVSLFRLSAGY